MTVVLSWVVVTVVIVGVVIGGVVVGVVGVGGIVVVVVCHLEQALIHHRKLTAKLLTSVNISSPCCSIQRIFQNKGSSEIIGRWKL